MFGNRSNNSNDVWNIGYDPKLDDVVGSSTWLRRMDRYEKEFDALSDEEKKARVHKIDLEGWLVDLLLLMEVCRLLHNYKRKFRDKKLEQPEKKRVIRLSDNMMN